LQLILSVAVILCALSSSHIEICAIVFFELRGVNAQSGPVFVACNQARNHEGEAPLEKCVEHSLKILDIVQKIWAPLGKLFSPPGVPRKLRACVKQINLRSLVFGNCRATKGIRAHLIAYGYLWSDKRIYDH